MVLLLVSKYLLLLLNHKQSDKYICLQFNQDFRFFSYRFFLSSRVSFSTVLCFQNFSRQSPKNSNRNLKRFTFPTAVEKVLFYICFKCCFIVPLFYTEKGNCFFVNALFSLSRIYIPSARCIFCTASHTHVCVGSCVCV